MRQSLSGTRCMERQFDQSGGQSSRMKVNQGGVRRRRRISEASFIDPRHPSRRRWSPKMLALPESQPEVAEASTPFADWWARTGT